MQYLQSISVFYVSCFLAFVAGHMMNYSAILFSLEFFQSSAIAGLAYGLCFGPPLILGWIAGAYIDRYGAKNMLLLGQMLFMTASVSLWLLSDVMLTAKQSSPWIMLLFLTLNALVGCAWAFVAPARMSVLALYVKVSQLHQATIVFNLLVMIGFGLAPICLTWLKQIGNWQVVYAMASIMFVTSTLMLWRAPQNRHLLKRVNGSIPQQWQQCVAALKAEPVLVQLLFAAIIGYLAMGPLQVLLPQIATQYLALDVLAQGRYLGLIAIALVVGGLIAMKVKHSIAIGQGIVGTLALTGLGLLLTSNVHQVGLNALCLFLAMTFGGMGVSFIVAGLQHFSPQPVRGRVMSMYTMISQVVPAAAGTLAGVFAQISSPQISLSVIALILIVAALFLAKRGSALRAFNQF